MASFAERIIAAHQAGVAERRAAEELAQRTEDRKLQQDILKHQVSRLKIQDQLEARQAQIEQAKLVQGMPAPEVTAGTPGGTFTPEIRPPEGGGIPLIPSSIPASFTRELSLPPTNIQGVPEMGLQETTIPTVSKQQQQRETLATHLQALRLEQLKPYSVPEGGMRVTPSLVGGPSTVFENPKAPPPPTGDFRTTYLPAYANKLGKTVETLTPDETLKAFSDFAQRADDPQMKELLETQRRNAILLQSMQLGQQPTKEQAVDVASDLIKHRMAPEQLSQMFGGFGASGQNFKRMVYAEAKKIDPEFDFEQASAEYQLTKSPAFQNIVRFMDAATESIPRLQDNATKLGNGKFRTWNEIVNASKNQFNDADLKAFKVDALLVGDEIAKLLQGGGTGSGTSDAKLQQAAQLINASDSVPAIAKAINEIQFLIGNRRKNLTKGTYFENVAPASNGPASNGQQEFDYVPGKGLVPRKPGG